MQTRPILIRVALALVLMAALAALADGVARHELRQATGDTFLASASIDAQSAGASHDE
ncbi:hypothetical protein [Methylobacterium sp. CM6257]|jgi:hypothetical protein